MTTSDQSQQSSHSMEMMLQKILGYNLALKLLLAGGYRWTVLAIVLSLIYFVIGLIIALLTNSSSEFLQTRSIYIMLIGLVIAVLSACWYPPLVIAVIAAVPRAFAVAEEDILQLVEKWTGYIRLPISLTAAFFTMVGSILYIVTRETFLASFSANPEWLSIYKLILNVIGAFICGGGFLVFFSTIVLFRQLFQYDMKLAQYRLLYPLNTLSTGLTIICLLGVSLYILLVNAKFDLSTLILTGLGILAALLMFIVPQVSYQEAVVRAKRIYLQQIDTLFEKYYRIIADDSVTADSLKGMKESVEALETLEKNIRSIPIWLIDLSDVSKILLSALAPIISLIISALLEKWI